MPAERVERRLAAILAADVAGYDWLMGTDEEGALVRLEFLRRDLIDSKIEEHHGHIVKTFGDAGDNSSARGGKTVSRESG